MGFPRILSNNNKVYTKLGEFCLSGDGNHFWIVCHTCQMELQTQDHFWKHIQDEHSFMHTKKQDQKRPSTFFETEAQPALLPFQIPHKFSQPKESIITSPPEYDDSDEHESITDIPIIDANAVEVKVEPEIDDDHFYGNFPYPSNANKTNDEVVASTSESIGKRKHIGTTDYKDNNRLSNTERDDNATSSSSSTLPPEDGPIDQTNFSPCNKLLFLSGKYYKIVKTVTDTEHQKKATGIIAACYNCKIEIRGYLQISSNFLSHMKTKHPERYQEFLDSKEQSKRMNHELKRKYKQQNHNWTWSY